LSLALVASGQFMGLLNLYSQDVARHFDPEEVKLAETFAQQAAIALSNAMLLERTREERGKFSAVLSSTTDAVLAIDEVGDLILANPAAERTFGLSNAQSLGRPLAGQVPSQLVELFEQVTASGKPVSVEIAADPNMVLYVSVSPVVGVGQVAVVQDITPLKELETMRLKAEQEERLRLHHIFEQYVGPELVVRILGQKAGMLERRERRDVVVLFTDLRGFTRLTATSSAHAVIEVLNEFFTAVVEIVYKHQGTVFDLAGDELMVGFGAPFDQEDASLRALRAAGDMQRVFAGLSRRWKEEQGIEVGLGVGIDRGTVVMGSIGAPSRMNYGMVGDTVNTAHRLVELAQHGEIIVSEEIVKSLDEELDGWVFEPLPSVEIKGKTLPVHIYLARYG
jgi:PAS domain S-box-containing protein